MAKVLDGRLVSDSILEKVKKDVETFKNEGPPPKLVVVMVGNNPASTSFIRQKEKAANKTGIQFEQINYSKSVRQEKLKEKIQELNADLNVHGILVQLPLPEHINAPLLLKEISPRKDVDGFHAYNIGKMVLSNAFESLVPCTPKGIIRLLDHYDIDVQGKDVTIVGHSNVVGKPMAIMLINRDATVTVCHVYTRNLKKHTENADILISAAGVAGLIKKNMVKYRAIVIDVGCNKIAGKLHGDVDYENVEPKSGYITPVPGGVGPMTVACLMENVITAYEWLKQHNFNVSCAE